MPLSFGIVATLSISFNNRELSLRRSCVGVREMLKDACTPMDIIRYHVCIYLTKKLVLVLNLFSIVLMGMIIREAMHFP